MKTLALALCFTASAAFAQTPEAPQFATIPETAPNEVVVKSPALNIPAPPARLAGRWVAPSGRSQRWALEKIDATSMRAQLTYYSFVHGCNMSGVDATLTKWDGKRLEAKVDRPNDCFGYFRVELDRTADGSNEFQGKILNEPKHGGAPVFTTTVSP